MLAHLEVENSSSDRRLDLLVHHDTGRVPATFWNAHPAADAAPPLVLLQHGGAVHRRHENTDRMAEAIVARTGGAVLLVDGPIHGRRRDGPLPLPEMLTAFERYWREDAGIDRMVADWRIALDLVLDRGWADPRRVVWVGLSMGTAYGIPVCAADDRIRAAALGMWGLEWGQTTRLLEDAARVTVPVLFATKDADEIFSAGSQRALFDALGSTEKRLAAFPGGHAVTDAVLDEILDLVLDAVAETRVGGVR